MKCNPVHLNHLIMLETLFKLFYKIWSHQFLNATQSAEKMIHVSNSGISQTLKKLNLILILQQYQLVFSGMDKDALLTLLQLRGGMIFTNNQFLKQTMLNPHIKLL